MQQPDKRQLRKLKRDIKRLGTKRSRRQLKRGLQEHPEEAHHDTPDFGRLSSETMNRLDQDATRRREE